MEDPGSVDAADASAGAGWDAAVDGELVAASESVLDVAAAANLTSLAGLAEVRGAAAGRGVE